MKNNMMYWLTSFLMLLCACASGPKATQTTANDESIVAPSHPPIQEKLPITEMYQPPKPYEGSLWTDSGMNLFGDNRAVKIGDLVTVRISENPKAKLHAKTDTNRETTMSGNANFLGYMEALQQKNKNLNPANLINTSFKPAFVGEGTNNRDGNMTAYVTSRVIRVLPNGNLYISGRREIKVDQETQYITLSGIVRPEDIDLNNEVQSTYISDAKIEYSGRGVIAERQRPGWMMRLLDTAWPF
ncbi:MAG: flagellar basal body L-ring protein FlgH [Candidatus Magnetomorum sp.]|nr:flagellar basal body L-ring protein FlgH [Candidatus Magnetomorum sp.]